MISLGNRDVNGGYDSLAVSGFTLREGHARLGDSRRIRGKKMSSKKLTDAEITEILNAEQKRLEGAWTPEEEAQKRVDAVKVMRIEHASNMARAKGRQDLIDGMIEDIRWAGIQLAGGGDNPYLTASDPAFFCQQLLDSRNPPPAPSKVSVDDVLNELSG